MKKTVLAAALAFSLGLAAAEPALAQPQYAAAPTVSSPYAPYAFLIGEWESSEQMGSFVQQFRWGPNNSYIQLTTSLMGAPGAAEHLHFEGIAVYNAANNNLDFLVVVEPGSFGQEHGTLHVDPGGLVIREIMLVSANGRTERFRQTFRSTGVDTAVTSLMRQAADGSWAPNFPGSDVVDMRRRRA